MMGHDAKYLIDVSHLKDFKNKTDLNAIFSFVKLSEKTTSKITTKTLTFEYYSEQMFSHLLNDQCVEIYYAAFFT